MIPSVEQEYLLSVLSDNAVHVVRFISIWEIDTIQSYVAKQDSVIFHVFHKHFSRDSCGTVGLHIMEVTM